MTISEKILQLREKQQITKRKIHTTLCITPSGLDDKLKKNFWNNNEIASLAELFDVSPTYFFDNDNAKTSVSGNGNTVATHNSNITLDTCKSEIESLKRELQLKDKIIQLLENNTTT